MPAIEQQSTDAELAYVNARGSLDIIEDRVAKRLDRRPAEALQQKRDRVAELRQIARTMAVLAKNKHLIDPKLLAAIEREPDQKGQNNVSD